MRRWFGGIATTCRTETAYEENRPSPNNPNAANPAMTIPFHAESHWRGVADPEH
jgi:hypothetical protein